MSPQGGAATAIPHEAPCTRFVDRSNTQRKRPLARRTERRTSPHLIPAPDEPVARRFVFAVPFPSLTEKEFAQTKPGRFSTGYYSSPFFRDAASSECVAEPSSFRTDHLTRLVPSPLPLSFRPQPLTDSLTLSPTPIFLHHIRRLFVSSLLSPRPLSFPDLPLSARPTLTPSRSDCSPTLESPGSSSASVRPASHACRPPNSSADLLYPSPDITPVHFHGKCSGCSFEGSFHAPFGDVPASTGPDFGRSFSATDTSGPHRYDSTLAVRFPCGRSGRGTRVGEGRDETGTTESAIRQIAFPDRKSFAAKIGK